ncbi:hypothetical protein O6H91_16G039100 [Diphasiastrum complanatum]|uniref:Uncharacterized protein n=1 Tax=Diphasiastrum complanatum TaxID=34168 RepID=A0ACC2BBI3_DIPCM|nr:hypothetical protein O6H91_16G039100 [Diphasiastrum complanatum]
MIISMSNMDSISYGRNTSSLLIVVSCVLLAAVQWCNAAQYKVGGDNGWVLGGSNYAAWSRHHNFRAGDTLLFQYPPGTHSVLQVSQQDFKDCSTSSPVLTATGGSNVIRLSKAGTYWFICGFNGHCSGGMKFAVQASGSAATAQELSESSDHYLNACPTQLS